MTFFLICVGYVAQLDEAFFYAGEALRIYGEYARGELDSRPIVARYEEERR